MLNASPLPGDASTAGKAFMNPRTEHFLVAAALSAALLAAGCSQPPAPPAPMAATPAASAAMANVSDMAVTEHVQTALNQSDALKGFDITVVTTNGDVRLNGIVDTQAQIDEALKVARAAEGSHTIHDELTIKK
jgi:PBP1b-binding outer membrane lipoprotein LpoB